jgi:hypothetical protein
MKISLYQTAIIMSNLQKLNKNPRYVDLGVNRTIEQLIRTLDVGVTVDDNILEETLYYMNLLGEDDKFKHPTDSNYKSFILNCLPKNRTFDFDRNMIKGLRSDIRYERKNTEPEITFIPTTTSNRDGN